MAAEAAFKDVPEIFEVTIRENLLKPLFSFGICIGRVGRVAPRTNRGPWCALTRILPVPLTLISLKSCQQRFVNSAHQTFAMSSRAPRVQASAK